MWHADLGLSKIQMHSALSCAGRLNHKQIDYVTFAQKCAPVIGHMLDLELQRQRRADIDEYRGQEGYSRVNGMTEVG